MCKLYYRMRLPAVPEKIQLFASGFLPDPFIERGLKSMKHRRYSVSFVAALFAIAAGGMSVPCFSASAEDEISVDEPAVEAYFAAGDEAVPVDHSESVFMQMSAAAEPAAAAAFNPTLHSAWVDGEKVARSSFYSKCCAVLLNHTLYAVGDGKAQVVANDVADYSHFTKLNEQGVSVSADALLKTNGSLYVNGELQKNSYGIVSLHDEFGAAPGNKLYSIMPYKNKFYVSQAVDNFERFLPDQETPVLYYTPNNTICTIAVAYNNQTIRITRAETSIRSAVAQGDDLYIDYNKNLLQLIREPEIDVKMIASYVKSLEYIGVRDGYKLYRYVQTNNRSFEVLSGVPAEDSTTPIEQKAVKVLSTADGQETGKTVGCTIGRDRTLSGTYGSKSFSVTNAETVLGADLNGQSQCCLYFLRTDGSIWKYNFETKECAEIAAGAGTAVKGDINGDGGFDIADLTMLQKWIRNDDGSVPNWKCGDVNKDLLLDTVDFAMMKRMLLRK